MVRNGVGTTAREEDCYNREESISLIWDRLKTGNVLLASPVDLEKTIVMYMSCNGGDHSQTE